MKQFTVEIPDDAVRVTVSCELPLGAGRSHAAPADPPSPPATAFHVTSADDDDTAGDWQRDDQTYPHEHWREADIRRIVASSSRDKLQPFLRFWRSIRTRLSRGSDLGAGRIGATSVQGMMSSITKRMRPTSYKQGFYDCRRNFDGTRRWEWRMRPREARIVLDALDGGERSQRAA